jgi:hypothetical protein
MRPVSPIEIDQYATEFEAFQARFARLFVRSEPREAAYQYLRGLLARRSVRAPTELAYYLSNAPADTPLVVLAEVTGARWSIETTIEEGKGEAGLDEYEVRYWHSWYRHITLAMMAHAWLAAMRQAVGEKSAGPGAGRVERARGTPAAGNRSAAASAHPRPAAGLVALATGPATAGST